MSIPYKCLVKQEFSDGTYELVPIRMEDRWEIMKWRNEQIYHLRQNKPLTPADQDRYFKEVVAELFGQEKPSQILFSFLKNGKCIGYGGLVHINWIDRNAEISFIMDTALEDEFFEENWLRYLGLIESVAFEELIFHKIFTYAFDIRPKLYEALMNAGFSEEARLKEHCMQGNKLCDVLIHTKINKKVQLVKIKESDCEITYKWAKDEIVRKYAFQKNMIDWESHSKWFNGKLRDENCLYYILYVGGLKVGSVRLDIDNQKETGTISYLIDPLFHGKGYGKIILEKLEAHIWRDFEESSLKLIGKVLKQNYASVKIFHQLSYLLVEESNDVLTYEKIIAK